MSLLIDWLSGPVVERLGWTLLHFLWQGTLLGCLAWCVRCLLRKLGTDLQYYFALFCLISMPCWCCVTFFQIKVDPSPGIAEKSPGLSPRTPDIELLELQSKSLSGRPFKPASGEILTREERDDSGLPTAASIGHATSAGLNFPSFFQRVLSRAVPWMVMGWLVGVCILSSRLVGGWLLIRRWRSQSVAECSAVVRQRMEILAERLKISRWVALSESTWVDVPTTFGALRPIILIPASLVSGLLPSELDAVLAHELAHIRRHDYLVNLLQSFIETVLFYHPAIWLLSATIRELREDCCDDLAARVTEGRVHYAQVLLRLAECGPATSRLAPAATGGQLLARVKRLLRPEPATRMQSGNWFVAALLIMIVNLMAWGAAPRMAASAPTAAQDSEASTAPSIRPVGVDSTSSKQQPIQTRSQAAETTPDAPNVPPPPVPFNVTVDDARMMSPSVLADQLERVASQYELVDYSSTFTSQRDTNPFGGEPHLVEGNGQCRYISDGNRWLVDEFNYSFNQREKKTYPTHRVEGYDGQTHYHLSDERLTLGEDGLLHLVYHPKEVFWAGGLNLSWLLAALRRTEARVQEVVERDGEVLVRIVSEWKPEWETQVRRFEITLSPNRACLPKHVKILRGGVVQSESTIVKISKSSNGRWYPAEMTVERTSDTVRRLKLQITAFNDLESIPAKTFQVPPDVGLDIVDYRTGLTWHNDPWWDELAPLLKEQMNWPRIDAKGARELGSYVEAKIQGRPAPDLQIGTWLNPIPNPDFASWSWPGRKLTLLVFFGGQPISPTPRWMAAVKALQARYGALGLDVIGVASYSATPEKLQQTVRELRLGFPVAVDQPPESKSSYGRTSESFSMRTYGGAFLVDAAGRVIVINPQDAPGNSKFSQVERLICQQLLGRDPAAEDAVPEWQTELKSEEILQIDAEWQRRRNSGTGRSCIQFEIDLPPDQRKLATCRLLPQFRLLMSSTPGGWFLGQDRKHRLEVSGDQTEITSLRKGEYQFTISCPGFVPHDVLVILATDQSVVDLGTIRLVKQ